MKAAETTNHSGRTIINNRDGSVLRLVPEGNFIMGSTPDEIAAAVQMDTDGPQFQLHNETPQLIAFVPDFYIGLGAVMNEQFAHFLSDVQPSPTQLTEWLPWLERIEIRVDSPHYRARSGFEMHPAVNVSWRGADAYCRWAGLRLPSEIEWEKAARGIDGRLFPWGNEWQPERLCWWGSHDGRATTVPVDAFPAGCSPYGIYGMVGNVEEWCADWYDPIVYQRYAAGDFAPPGHGLQKVVRGGNCLRRSRLEFRCARRRANTSTYANILFTGIRCACDRPTP